MPYDSQLPPPYDIEKEKGVQPLAQPQAVHVCVYVYMFNAHYNQYV